MMEWFGASKEQLLYDALKSSEKFLNQETQKMYNEQTEQITLINWCDFKINKYPELKWIFHIPNGGSRHPAEAANLKRQGVKSGVPDLFLPVPKKGYHGFFIEMKAGKNRTTPNQTQWLDGLAELGYKTAVCYGWENAAKEIELYLSEESEEENAGKD